MFISKLFSLASIVPNLFKGEPQGQELPPDPKSANITSHDSSRPQDNHEVEAFDSGCNVNDMFEANCMTLSNSASELDPLNKASTRLVSDRRPTPPPSLSPSTPRPRIRARFSFTPDSLLEDGEQNDGYETSYASDSEDDTEIFLCHGSLSRDFSSLSNATVSSISTPSLYGSYVSNPSTPFKSPFIVITPPEEVESSGSSFPIRPTLRRTRACADLYEVYRAEEEDEDATHSDKSSSSLNSSLVSLCDGRKDDMVSNNRLACKLMQQRIRRPRLVRSKAFVV